MECKSLEQRLQEAKVIYSQLQQVGALTHETTRIMLRNASNEFVSKGISKIVRLKFDDKVVAVVKFKCGSNEKSGIVMEVA